ncbi:Polyhomeotic-like protein 3, partial [Nibea albiflora]
ALATAHSVILKPSAQSQALTPASSLSKTAICSLKANQLTDASTETGSADVTRQASGHQIITPAYSPVQTHALVKQQLSCPPGQRVAHHQLILQQATGGASNHRQLQPIALRVAPQETNSNPLPLSTSIPAAAVQPQPPPLVAAPQRRTSFPQMQNQPPPPPPPLVLPRLPQNPPASLQRLSLHSVQALAVQSGRVLLTEQELPVAEALVQMPYQNLPPPQTVAVDLKVHPVRRNETPSSGQTCKVNGLSSEERKDASSPSPQRDRTPTSLTGPPKQNGAEPGESAAGVLQCEFCGSRGYAHTFLRSKRFCSMTCVRREREREREQERQQEERRMTETISVSDGEEEEEEEEEDEEEGEGEDAGRPSQWNVEQVFSYINSLPGGQDIAEEFRSQEIDGQALLLLTEDHLVSTMNLKLGPALKLCAHINSLKDA